MSRRKQARPRLLKRDEDEEVESDMQIEEEEGQKEVEKETNTGISGSLQDGEVKRETETVKGIVNGERNAGGTNLQCDVCDAKFLSLDQFMDHRNFDCTGGPWTIDNLAAKMSQLEDPPSSPESCDQSSMEPDSPFPMDTNDLNPEDLPGGIGVSQANPYGCQFCNQAFPRLRHLKIHEQIHIDQLPFRCEHCSRRFRHKRSLDRHVKLHNGEKKYKCGDCSAAFVRSDHLKVHQKTHGNLEEAFRCILCGKSFGSMALLTSHVVTHDMSTENLQRFNCSKCQGTFPTQSELNSHMMLHNMDMSTTQKAFHCTYCPEICLGPESLELHVQSKHTHRCKFCPHIAVSLEELSQHMKCHDHQQTGQNDVIMIDNNDGGKSAVMQGKDLLVCPYCFCSDFTSLEVLEIHMQSIHSVKPAEVYTCNYCNAPYKNLYSLHEHMRAVHQNQPCLDIKYPCSLCGRQFGSIETLIQHKRALHPDEHKRSRSEYIKNLPRRDSRSKESPRQKQTTDDTNTKTIDNKSPIGFAKQPDASEKVSNSLPKPLQQESIVCEYCNATFYDFNNFQRHMKHHLENTFWCKLCNQKFTSEEQLETHAASHYLRKTTQYGCTCCIKMFDKPDELQKHLMDIHAHHLYRCALCKEIFDSKVNIQVHFAVKHSNECQIYQCSACESVFRSEMEWQIHLRVNHLQVNKPYRCLFCKDSFSTEMDLQCHLTTHNQPLKCPMCDEAFNVEYLLDKHVNDVHSHSTVDTPRSVEVDSNQGLSVKVKEEKKDPTSRIEVQTTGISGFSGFPTNSPGKWTSPTPPNITGVNMWGSVDRDNPWKSPPSNSPGAWKISPVNSPSLWKTSELLHTCNICDVKFFHQSALQMHKAVDHRLTDRHHSSSHSPVPETSETEIKISPLSNHSRSTCSPNSLNKDQRAMSSSSLAGAIETGSSQSSASMSLPVVVVHDKLNSACMLSCMYCSQTFKNRGDLDKHIKIHLNSGSQKCNICDKIFATPGILAEHKLTHCKIQHGNMCVLCKIPLKSEDEFYLHSQEHGGQSSYMQCIVCRQTLVSLAELQMHGKHHFQVKSGFFSCCICHKTFDSKENLVANDNINGGLYYVCKPCYHGDQEEFTCTQCNAKFLTALQLEAHSETHRKTYQCIKCQESFSSEHEIQMHVASHVMREGNVHECKLCNQTFESPAKLQCHLIEHTFNNTDITCTVCCRKFQTASEIQQHVVEHGTGYRRYACAQCNQRFFFSAELENHKFSHNSEPGFSPNSNSKTSSNSKSSPSSSNSLLKQALNSVSQDIASIFQQSSSLISDIVKKEIQSNSNTPPEEGEFKCSDCNKSFSMMVNLINHRKLHEKREQNYKCSLCPKILNSMTELQRHFFMDHSNTELDSAKTVYRCPECDEEFPCQSNLQGHMRIHSAGTKYPCPHCPKVFALSRNLTIHMRSHSGEKPYQCPICHKRFARKENRKAHLRSHGGVKPFLCPMCGKSFTRKCHVKEHMKCHFTQENPVEIDESSILEVDINSDNASLGEDDVTTTDEMTRANDTIMADDDMKVNDIITEDDTTGNDELAGNTNVTNYTRVHSNTHSDLQKNENDRIVKQHIPEVPAQNGEV